MRTCRAAAAGKLTVVLATLVLTVAACGGGPSPRAWASSVCEALAPWRAEISKLTSSTEQQMTAQTTPAQAKENLVRLFAGAEQASETARRRIEQAGIPETEHGADVSQGFQASLGKVRDAYGRARDTIDGLSTGQPAAFYDGVQAAVNTLNKELTASRPPSTPSTRSTTRARWTPAGSTRKSSSRPSTRSRSVADAT